MSLNCCECIKRNEQKCLANAHRLKKCDLFDWGGMTLAVGDSQTLNGLSLQTFTVFTSPSASVHRPSTSTAFICNCEWKEERNPLFYCITTRALLSSPRALQMHQVECECLENELSLLAFVIKFAIYASFFSLPLFRIFTPKKFYMFFFISSFCCVFTVFQQPFEGASF